MNMEQTIISNNRSVPEEIIEDILSRLPVTTLLRFKSVSKSLFNLIISQDFVKLHLSRSVIRNSTVTLLYQRDASLASFDFNQPQSPVVQLDTHPDVIKLFEPFSIENATKFKKPRIIGISNGVVCFRKADEFILYNPATHAYKQVPRWLVSRRYDCRDEFAYDCVSGDFKIFNFIGHFGIRSATNGETYLYKLKDNSWSKIETSPRYFHCFHLSRSCIADNSLFWISCDYRLSETVIMCFDVSSHRLEEISLPLGDIYQWNIRLEVLRGRLHIMESDRSRCQIGFNIWMLNDDKCWTQLFHSSYSEFEPLLSAHSVRKIFPSPYAYSKDGRKIIVGQLQRFTKVISCDLESETISVVQVLGLSEGGAFAIPWVESLVPLA